MFLECGDVPGFLIIHSGNNVFSCKLQNKNDGFQAEYTQLCIYYENQGIFV